MKQLQSKVLIIDDDANFTNWLRYEINYEFKQDNVKILSATGENQALSYLSSEHHIALIILDFMIPGKNGLEILNCLKSKFEDLPSVIFLTNYDGHMLSCLKYGAVDCISKPKSAQDREVLFRKIKNLITEYKKSHSVEKEEIQNELNLKSAELKLEVASKEQTEQRLKYSESKYKQLVNLLPATVFELDTNGKFLYVNKFGLDLFQYDFSDLDKGIYLFDIVDPNYMQEIKSRFKERIENNIDKVLEYEFIAIKKDRTKFPFVVHTSIINKNYEAEGLRGIGFDITKIRQYEKRISELNKCFLNFSNDPQENINRLVEYIGKQLNGFFALYNKAYNDNLCTKSYWNIPSDLKLEPDPIVNHICNDVINSHSDKVLIVKDLQLSKYKTIDKAVNKYKLQTYIGQPIILNMKHIGSLCIVYKNQYSVSEEDKKLIGVIASSIATEESRKTISGSLLRSHKILEITLQISSRVTEDEQCTIDEVLELIGNHLNLQRIFIIKFPELSKPYKEWSLGENKNETKNETNKNEIDNSKLMNWCFKNQPYFFSTEETPEVFDVINEILKKDTYYKMVTPIMIEKRPWGIIGFGSSGDFSCCDTVLTSMMNLSTLISIIIKNKESREKLEKLIETRLNYFKNEKVAENV